MAQLKTQKALLERLKESATRQLDERQLHRQSVSFVMGMLSEKSPVTRDQVRASIERQTGKKGVR